VLLGLRSATAATARPGQAGYLFAFFTAGLAIPGAILARRRPAIPISWLFLAAALPCALAGFDIV
jgi:hypothetical protein